MKSMVRYFSAGLLIAVAAVMVACGSNGAGGSFAGPGVNPSIQTVGHDARKHKGKGELRIKIKIPPAHVQLPPGHISVALPVSGTAQRHTVRKPKYISPATQSMTISVPGQPNQTFNLTPGSAGCSTDQQTGYLTCSESAFFPSGQQTVTITLYDQTGGNGNALSTATTTATITAGGVTYISVTLEGVVASAVVLIAGGASASVPEGTATSLPVTVSAYDADHDLIVAPGNYDSTTPVTLSDSDSSGTTSLSSTSVKGPGASITLSYTGGNISSATLTANVNGAAQANPATLTVTPLSTPTPVVSPASLSFSTGATQTFVVSEPGYSGTLTATSSDTTVATVSPSSASGPSATFTVTPVGGGTCTITVTDSHNNSAAVSVSVNGGVIVIDETPVATPTSLTFDTAASQTFEVKEKQYDGVFSESDTCSGIASTSPSSANGPNATFTVTPVNGGSCAITVSDAQGNPATVGVSVSGGGITINTKHNHTQGGK